MAVHQSNLWWLGVIFALLACVGTTTGLLMQKYSHNLVVSDEASRKRKQRLWWTSLIFLMVVPAPLDIMALALAAQSLLAPLTAATLLFTLIAAPLVLDERIYTVDIVALVLIIVGSVFSTHFGTHQQEVYDVPALHRLFARADFLVIQTVIVLQIVVLALLVNHNDARLQERQDEHKDDDAKHRRLPSSQKVLGVRLKMPLSLTPVAHAFVTALIGAQQLVLTKIGAELLLLTVNGRSQMKYVAFWLIGIVGSFIALVQVKFLSDGLARYEAVYFLSIYNAMLITFSIACGAVYFAEFEKASNREIGLFFLGAAISVAGVLVLMKRPPSKALAAIQAEEKAHEVDPERESLL